MIGIRNFKLEVETAKRRLEEASKAYDNAKGLQDRLRAKKALAAAQARLSKMNTKLYLAGSMEQVALITWSIGNGVVGMIYLTHDDEEIDYLVKRDAGPIEYKVQKLFTGSQYPSK